MLSTLTLWIQGFKQYCQRLWAEPSQVFGILWLSIFALRACFYINSMDKPYLHLE